MSQLTEMTMPQDCAAVKPTLRIWARPEFQGELKGLYEKIGHILESIRKYWNVDLPQTKLDIVALPGYSALKPIDNWGLVVFK